MQRARASDHAALDTGGRRRDDGEPGGAQATPQGASRQQSGEHPWSFYSWRKVLGHAIHAGRGRAPVPESDPGSAASIVLSLAESDDKNNIRLLEEVSP